VQQRATRYDSPQNGLIKMIEAIESHDSATAASVATAHIEASQRARLEQFDQREQEASLPRDIPAFLNRIRAELA